MVTKVYIDRIAFKRACEKRGLTQSGVAMQMAVDPRTIRRYIAKEKPQPVDPDTLIQLAKVLRVDAKDIILNDEKWLREQIKELEKEISERTTQLKLQDDRNNVMAILIRNGIRTPVNMSDNSFNLYCDLLVKSLLETAKTANIFLEIGQMSK